VPQKPGRDLIRRLRVVRRLHGKKVFTSTQNLAAIVGDEIIQCDCWNLDRGRDEQQSKSPSPKRLR